MPFRRRAVGYVNAHGTGTRLNDRCEVAALGRCSVPRLAPIRCRPQGDAAWPHASMRPACSEALVTVLALRDGLLPPTVDFRVADPSAHRSTACPSAARPAEPEVATEQLLRIRRPERGAGAAPGARMGSSAYLQRIGTATPRHDVHEAFVDYARQLIADERERLLFDRMVERSGIEHRYAVLRPGRLSVGEVDAEKLLPARAVPRHRRAHGVVRTAGAAAGAAGCACAGAARRAGGAAGACQPCRAGAAAPA